MQPLKKVSEFCSNELGKPQKIKIMSKPKTTENRQRITKSTETPLKNAQAQQPIAPLTKQLYGLVQSWLQNDPQCRMRLSARDVPIETDGGMTAILYSKEVIEIVDAFLRYSKMPTKEPVLKIAKEMMSCEPCSAYPVSDQQAQADDSDGPIPVMMAEHLVEKAEDSACSELPQAPADYTPKRKYGRPSGGRSEAEALAKPTAQCRYGAERMVKLGMESPELAKAVAQECRTIKEATQKYKAPVQQKNDLAKKDDIAIVSRTAQTVLASLNCNLHADDQAVFWTKIAEFARNQTELSKPEEP
jgi:hypothetical protein